MLPPVAAYSLMLLLILGPNVTPFCEAWCESQAAAATSCHARHVQSTDAPSLAAHHECAQMALGVSTFLPEAGRRAAAPDASDAISVPHDQRPEPTRAGRSDQRGRRGGPDRAYPLTTALRI